MRTDPAFGRRLLGAALLLGLATPALAGDLAAGRSIAQAKCAVCHGIDGLAVMPIAPHLAGESAAYLTTQLAAFRSGRREHEIMSIIAADMSDEDMDNVAAWYAAIKITVELPE